MICRWNLLHSVFDKHCHYNLSFMKYFAHQISTSFPPHYLSPLWLLRICLMPEGCSELRIPAHIKTDTRGIPTNNISLCKSLYSYSLCNPFYCRTKSPVGYMMLNFTSKMALDLWICCFFFYTFCQIYSITSTTNPCSTALSNAWDNKPLKVVINFLDFPLDMVKCLPRLFLGDKFYHNSSLSLSDCFLFHETSSLVSLSVR